MSLMKLHGSSGGEHINPQDPKEWVAFQRLMERDDLGLLERRIPQLGLLLNQLGELVDLHLADEVHGEVALVTLWAEPDEHPRSGAVELVHDSDLVTALALIGLIDADGINPETTHHRRGHC